MRRNHLNQPIGEPVEWTPPPAPPREAFEGRYCRVEPLEPERHARGLWHANARDVQGRNWTYLSYGPFETFEAYEDWVRRVSEATDPLFFCVVTEDGPAGVAAYLRVAPNAGSVEVGHINFSPLLQRTRAATEAMYLMMRRGFELGYRRYEWKCDALNAPSRAARSGSGCPSRACSGRRSSRKDVIGTRRGMRPSTENGPRCVWHSSSAWIPRTSTTTASSVRLCRS